MKILLNSLETAAAARFVAPFLQVPQLLALVVQQLLELPLDKRWLAVPLARRPDLCLRLQLLDLGLQVRQLLLQPHLFPVVCLFRAKIRSRALESTPAESGQVLIAKLGLAARRGLVVCFDSPAALGSGSLVIELVVYLVALEAGAKGGRNGAWDSEALVSVVEDVEEGEAGVFVDGARGGGVDEIPGGADVRVGNVEAVV